MKKNLDRKSRVRLPLTKYFKKFYLKIFIFFRRCRWHRWQTFIRKYHRKFSKKFEMIPMRYSEARGTLIYEKNLRSKISCQTPFKSKPFQKCVLLTRTKLWALDRYFLEWKSKKSQQCLPGQSYPPAQARPPSSCRWRRWRRSRRWPSWCSPSYPLLTRRCNTRTIAADLTIKGWVIPPPSPSCGDSVYCTQSHAVVFIGLMECPHTNTIQLLMQQEEGAGTLVQQHKSSLLDPSSEA